MPYRRPSWYTPSYFEKTEVAFMRPKPRIKGPVSHQATVNSLLGLGGLLVITGLYLLAAWLCRLGKRKKKSTSSRQWAGSMTGSAPCLTCHAPPLPAPAGATTTGTCLADHEERLELGSGRSARTPLGKRPPEGGFLVPGTLILLLVLLVRSSNATLADLKKLTAVRSEMQQIKALL